MIDHCTPSDDVPLKRNGRIVLIDHYIAKCDVSLTRNDNMKHGPLHDERCYTTQTERSPYDDDVID